MGGGGHPNQLVLLTIINDRDCISVTLTDHFYGQWGLSRVNMGLPELKATHMGWFGPDARWQHSSHKSKSVIRLVRAKAST